jgi:hypothetical protein
VLLFVVNVGLYIKQNLQIVLSVEQNPIMIKWMSLQIFRIKKTLRWILIIWKTPNWSSYHALYIFMLYLRDVRENIKNVPEVGKDKQYQRMWEFEQILKRIIQDEETLDYNFHYYRDFMPHEYKACWMDRRPLSELHHTRMLEQQDMELLSLYFKKYFEGWEG